MEDAGHERTTRKPKKAISDIPGDDADIGAARQTGGVLLQAGPEFEPGTGAVEAEDRALPHELIEDGFEAGRSQSPAGNFRFASPVLGH